MLGSAASGRKVVVMMDGGAPLQVSWPTHNPSSGWAGETTGVTAGGT